MDISCLYVKCDEPMVTIIVQFTQPIQVSAHTVSNAAQGSKSYSVCICHCIHILFIDKQLNVLPLINH